VGCLEGGKGVAGVQARKGMDGVGMMQIIQSLFMSQDYVVWILGGIIWGLDVLQVYLSD